METEGNQTVFRWEVGLMKKVNMRILLGFQIAALPCLLAALLELILRPFGYHVYLFGQVGRPWAYFGVAAFMMIECVMLLVLAIVNRRFSLFLPDLFVIPLAYMTLLFGMMYTQDASKVYRYDEFDKDIVITSWSFLFAAESNIYQKELPFIVKDVATAWGDDCYCPLLDEDAYRLTVSEEGLEYYYSNGSGGMERLRLIYQDGDFIAVDP